MSTWRRASPSPQGRGRFQPGIERLEDRRVLNAAANDAFVSQLYQDVLGREADADGLEFFSGLLDAGVVNRALVVSSLVNSPEYREEAIANTYTHFLDREPDEPGESFWFQFLSHGGTVEGMETAILGSPEYYAERGGGTTEGFLNALYGEVLNRPPDDAGLQAWTHALQLGVPSWIVAGVFLGSQEADKLAVEEMYDQYLERPADVFGLGGFTNALQKGLTENQARVFLLGSDEYYARQSLPTETAPLSQFTSEAELEQYLLDSAVQRYQGIFGTSWQSGGWLGAAVDSGLAQTTTALSAFSAPPESAPTGFSNTNVQVQGVDEADLVKTDGEFLYVLSNQDLVIVDAKPADHLNIVARQHFDGNPFALYLNGDRLTVLSNVYPEVSWPVALGGPADQLGAAVMPIHFLPKVMVSVFDVSHPAAPQLLHETELEGSYVDSRSIGDAVYVVVQNDLHAYGWPEAQCTDTTCTYETEAEYRQRLSQQFEEDGLPQYHTHVAGGAEVSGPLSQATDIYKPIATGDDNLVSVVVFDTGSDVAGPVDSVGVLAPYASTIYVSADNLYLVTPHWNPLGGTSSIYKFDLQGTSVDLAARGEVNGFALDQFSLDEHDGYLRIATTVNAWPTPPTTNLYVLGQDGDALEVVGRIVDLAAGERLFSTQFLGDRGYLVTFRLVDPLFSLDLSDPTAPRVAGELKIPGFSEYLQPIDENHLLGIGRAADPLTGRAGELQLSLFDVSNLSAPQVIDQESVDAGLWAWSDALYNHHAVGYYPEAAELAIPVSGHREVHTQTPGGQDQVSYEYVSALYVFDVDLATGFQLLGQIDHDSPVLRSLRIDDVLYSLSSTLVQAHQLFDPQTQLGEVRIGTIEPPPVPVLLPLTGGVGAVAGGAVTLL